MDISLPRLALRAATEKLGKSLIILTSGLHWYPEVRRPTLEVGLGVSAKTEPEGLLRNLFQL
jgi:hypothetical protein